MTTLLASRPAVRKVLAHELPQIARMVIAAAVGWEICILLGAHNPPIYAVLVPLVSLRDDPFSAFNVSAARLVGVVVGLSVGIGIVSAMGINLLSVVLVLLAALLLGMLFRVGNTLNMQVAISALLIFTNPDPDSYGVTRLWETGVGTAVALALAPFLFPSNPLRTADREMREIAAGLAGELRSSVSALVAGRVPDTVAGGAGQKSLDGRISTLAAQVELSKKSARWSLLQRRNLRAVAAMGPLVELAGRISARLSGFMDEAAELVRRHDFSTDPHLQAEPLSAISAPVADAIEGVLTGHPYAEPLAVAEKEFVTFRSVEHSHVASLVRRPLARISGEIGEFGP